MVSIISQWAEIDSDYPPSIYSPYLTANYLSRVVCNFIFNIQAGKCPIKHARLAITLNSILVSFVKQSPLTSFHITISLIGRSNFTQSDHQKYHVPYAKLIPSSTESNFIYHRPNRISFAELRLHAKLPRQRMLIIERPSIQRRDNLLLRAAITALQTFLCLDNESVCVCILCNCVRARCIYVAIIVRDLSMKRRHGSGGASPIKLQHATP
jgi:hypothetical protein